MLITFSGLDGAGKSTLIASLRTALEARNTAVVVCHMNHDIGVYAAGQALRNRLFGPRRARRIAADPSAGTHSLRSETRTLRSAWQRLRYAILWNKPGRRLIYLADLVIFAVFRLYIERLLGRVLIMDRYFYDTLVDVAGPFSWGWARFLASITPTPNLAVLLDVSPELAYTRKGEHSVNYLARRALAYRRVFDWVPSAVIIENGDLARTSDRLHCMVTFEDGP
jgi:thymidylate kinase